jgi:hypothetical protein
MNDVSVLSGTEDTVVPDRTSGGKAHFEVFDGLRGSAAFLVFFDEPIRTKLRRYSLQKRN